MPTSTQKHSIFYNASQTLELPRSCLKREELPGRVPHLLAVLMPRCVHEAVVVEESQLLAEQTVHDVGSGILPLQQASK